MNDCEKVYKGVLIPPTERNLAFAGEINTADDYCDKVGGLLLGDRCTNFNPAKACSLMDHGAGVWDTNKQQCTVSLLNDICTQAGGIMDGPRQCIMDPQTVSEEICKTVFGGIFDNGQCSLLGALARRGTEGDIGMIDKSNIVTDINIDNVFKHMGCLFACLMVALSVAMATVMVSTRRYPRSASRVPPSSV